MNAYILCVHYIIYIDVYTLVVCLCNCRRGYFVLLMAFIMLVCLCVLMFVARS